MPGGRPLKFLSRAPIHRAFLTRAPVHYKGKKKYRPAVSTHIPRISSMTKYVRLRYGIAGTYRSTAAVYLQQFRANSLFQVDETAASGQPRGYDEWMAFYYHYCVISAKINVTIAHTAAAQETVFVGLRISGDSTEPASMADLQESRRGQSVLVKANSSARIKSAVNIGKFLGLKGSIVGNSLTRGTVGTNPEDMVYYQFLIWTLTGTNPGPYVEMSGYIDFLVAFTEPKMLAGST